MKPKIAIPILLLCSMLIAAACASLKLPGTSSNALQNAQTPGAFDPRKMPVEMKLAVGTLKLEKTDQAVTPAQAKELLPLWKAVKSLSSSDTTTQEEVDGLYSQIKDTMTPEQVQAIEKMELTQDDFNALMKDLGIQFPQGGPGGPGEGMQNLSESERATRVAQFRTQNQNGSQGGQQGGGSGFEPGGGGFPPGGDPGGFGGPPGEGGTTGQGNSTTRQTPGAGQRTGRRGLGMNTLFVDPLIKMLETRAGG
jgi:hypothetical protein